LNFLELCQTVRGDASLQGEGPTSVAGQTGIYAKIVRWTNEAYIEIQSLGLDFDWLRAMCDVPLAAGVGSYDLLSGASWNRPDVKRFLSGNSWLYDDAGKRSRVRVIDHAQMLRDWPDTSGVGIPSAVTIRPWRVVEFNRVPEFDYIWKVEAKLTPESMSIGEHVPMMPEQHHHTIVKKALMYYATHDGDSELFKQARDDYGRALNRLVIETVPAIERVASRGED